ncbi:encapsulin [Methanococcoides sp. AM1]|uniref:encapsulin n=1 Tax=Methanococcoides sp. AM1 TaxID=1201011 RepID=UPI0010829128|nr:encapsulin [Methanococcoides sp. AM1]
MAVLTAEEKRTVRKNIIGVAEKKLVARKILAPNNVDKGAQEFGYDKLTDMTDAEIISKFSPGSKDTLDLTRKAKGIPILHKGYSLSRIDMFSSRRLKSASQDRATKKVSIKEDDLIINGDSTYGIDGLADVYNNAVTAGQNWGSGTFTDAQNPYQDIINLKATIEADGFDCKFVMMHPTNAGEARKKVSNAAGTWMEMIKEEVPNILVTTAVSEGTVFGGDIGADIAELVIAEEFKLLDPNNADQMVFDFDIIDRVLPMYYEYGDTTGKSDAFGAITGA